MDRSLTIDELLVLGGLLRILVRLDGAYTPEENSALKSVLAGLDARGASFFGHTADPSAPVPSIWELMGRAAREVPDENAVKRAADRVRDPAARDAIFHAVRAVAESDGIVASEQTLLDWLDAWKSAAGATE